MDISSCLILIALLYCVLLFFDTFFKTCAHYPYIQFLKGTGLDIKFLYLRWNTTVFNRLLVRWGSSHLRFFNLWFTIGMYSTLLLIPVAFCLLWTAIFQMLYMKSDKDGNQNLIIEPVIPGVNLPASELGYYSVSLIFCSIIHEFGHALAAVKEDVHLVNVGISIFFVVPVAYVNISSEKLLALNPWRALRILCAGIWHNLILACLFYLLYLCMPYIFSTMFFVNNGVSVSYVASNSFLLGPKGTTKGDIITQINDCVVRDDATWSNCLWESQFHKPAFCVNTDIVHSLDESITVKQLQNGAVDCCGPNKADSLCFEYLDFNDGVLELPPHMCLPARAIVESFIHYCNGNTKPCPNNLHCIRPILPNVTTLLKIKRIQKADIIYIGHPIDVLTTVHVSQFVPKHFFSNTWFPDITMKLLKYLIVFSVGLALVNVIPCMYMDGQHITNFLVQIVFAERVQSRHTVRLISLSITFLGTLILVFNFIYTFWINFLNT